MSNSGKKLDGLKLRAIGWTIWDPIGMRPDVESWDDDENCTYLDEYDSYLVNAAGRLRNGVPEADVVSYLVEIETEHMGLGLSETTIKRAEEVVTAMRTDERLWVD